MQVSNGWLFLILAAVSVLISAVLVINKEMRVNAPSFTAETPLGGVSWRCGDVGDAKVCIRP